MYNEYRYKRELHNHEVSMQMKKEMVLRHVKNKKFQIYTFEDLDLRLSLIPENSKRIFEARWGLDGGSTCNNFKQLDRKLEISNSKELYVQAEKDLANTKGMIYFVNPESIPFERAVNIGKLAHILVKKFIHDETIKIDANKLVECIYSSIKGNDRDIIIARYGLETGEPQIAQEVAKTLNITQARVTQLEYKALERLKYFSFYYVLQDEKSLTSEVAQEQGIYTLQQLVAVSLISTQTYNTLMRNGIDTIEKLKSITPEELMKTKSIGKTRCQEILLAQEVLKDGNI